MKNEIRRRFLTTETPTIVDEETKNELMRRCREEIRASFIKQLAAATSKSPSP